MKELLEKLKQDYVKHYGIYERLERDTFDSSNTEDYEDTVTRLYEQGYSDALNMVIKQLENSEGAAFQEGVIYALEYLSDLYDGITETDIWADYMKKENN